jgi:hypothetical protein
MCEPTTIMMAATAISGGLSAYGQIQQGNAAMESARYQSAIQRNNAIMEENRATQERMKGDVEANQKRREIARLIGAQRAGVGASGVEMSGSYLDVLSDSATQGALDVAMIRYNAETRARDYEFSASNLRAQSDLTLAEGRSAKQASRIGAFATLLGTASSVSGMWNTHGAPGGGKLFGGRLGRSTTVTGSGGSFGVKKG